MWVACIPGTVEPQFWWKNFPGIKGMGAQGPVPPSPVSCSRGLQRDPACGEGGSRTWPALLRTCTRPLLSPCPLGPSLIRPIVHALQAQDCGPRGLQVCWPHGPASARAAGRQPGAVLGPVLGFCAGEASGCRLQ